MFYFIFTRLQNQVDEVVGVMQNNVSKVMERGDKLEDLQDQSGKIIYMNMYMNYTIRQIHLSYFKTNDKETIVIR